MGERDAEFRDFAVACSTRLLRTAVLLTGDRHLAEDLLQTTLAKVYVAWGRISEPAAAHAYARRVMATTYTSWWRRRAFGELSTAAFDDHGAPISTAVEDRDELRHLLAALPRVERAVLVLRFAEDLSVRETARELNLREGTVKSHTSRALERLRVELGEADRSPEGVPR